MPAWCAPTRLVVAELTTSEISEVIKGSADILSG